MFILYLILGGLALGLGLFWLRSQEPRLLKALAGVAAVLALLFVYDKLRPETVAEQMQRKTEAMAKAVATRDLDGLFQHLADSFQTNHYDKASLRLRAEWAVTNGELTEVVVWDFDNAQVQDATASIDFKVKARGGAGEHFFRCTAQFVQEGEGEWRLQGFKLFDGLGNRELAY